MEITFVGHACFLIRFDTGLTVCFDPYKPGSVPGLSDANVSADEVYCSHSHRDHCDYESVGKPFDPYEGPAPEVKIIRTFHDEVQGAKRGRNNVTKVTSGNETVVHMGDIGCDLTDEQIEEIKGCDLLLIPVGGFYTIDCRKAHDMVGQIDPKVVIPMHYRSKLFGYDEISGREEFVELIGNDEDREIISRRFICDELPKVKSLLLMEPLKFLR